MKTFKLTSCGVEYECCFCVDRYSNNGGLYIGIHYFDDEFNYWMLYGDVSTNLEFSLPKNHIAIKQYSGGDVLEKILKELGIIKKYAGTVTQGYGEFDIVEIDIEKLKEYLIEDRRR